MEQRTEEAKRIAHTLKGVSGNISAKGVFALSEQVEKALSLESPHDYSELLDRLDQEIRAIVDALDVVPVERQSEIAESDEEIDKTKITPILLEATRLIWTDDIESEAAIQKLKQALGSRFATETDEIARSVDGFDFDAAKRPLQRIANELSIRLEGTGNE